MFIYFFFSAVLLAVSPLTSAAISVDRLLALYVGAEIQTRCNFMPSSCGHGLCLVHCCFKRFFALGVFYPKEF